MNNILLLTDFSEASLHASRYAALLTQQLRSERMVLYHAYQVILPIPVSEIPVPVQVSNESEMALEDAEVMRRKSLKGLKALYDELRAITYENTILEYRAEDANLALSINDIAAEAGADLIVMAITPTSKLERALVGNDTINVADESDYPVLIVPPTTLLAPVQRIVLAAELKKSQETKPVKDLKKLLDDFQAELEVVDVDNPGGAEGILEFTKTYKASLIIVTHRHYGFFEGLFHRSATHDLAYHTSVPLLVLREEASS